MVLINSPQKCEFNELFHYDFSKKENASLSTRKWTKQDLFGAN